MAEYDVIVVGAGPAGATAAFCLARAGVRVLIVDKNRGDHEKVCGGGLLRGSLRQLRHLGLLERVVGSQAVEPQGARIVAPNGTMASLPFPKSTGDDPGFIRIIRRADLDNALIQAACSAGATLMPGVHASSMSSDDQGATLYTEERGLSISLHSQLVIAADGATGMFSRRLGLSPRSQTCLAVRAYVASDDRYPDMTDFLFLPQTLPLYCWVFPVAPGLCNVGLALSPGRDAGLVAQLRRTISETPALRDRLPRAEIVDGIQGGILRTGLNAQAVFAERLLAVGDAAALVSPLTGEGIKQALVSGELAAMAALDAFKQGDFMHHALAPYGQKLKSAFARRNRQLMMLNTLISHPWVMNRMVWLLESDQPLQNLLQGTLANPQTWGVGSLAKLLARILFASSR
ncbi:MAG: NAD(P)/FAD-dependent oxidoreductase [Anaerolineae bacterium]